MSSTTKKALAVLGLVILCYIPTVFVVSIIRDRQIHNDEVRAQVAKEWGNAQEILGPILVVPYKKIEMVEGKTTVLNKYLYIFPENENLNIALTPAEKLRGIFHVPVYDAELSGDVTFNIPTAEVLNEYGREFLWGKAIVGFPITDVRSIEPESKILLDGVSLPLSQSSGMLGQTGALIQGVHVKANILEKKMLNVTFSITVNGNEHLSFIPAGTITTVNAHSSWRTPSFAGAYLPVESSLQETGFEANWRVSGLGRSFPQISSSDTFSEFDVRQSLTTISLFNGINQYVLLTRSVKYAILFIALTFMGFFFVEVLNALRVHPIQYAFVGAALALFYLLLLSLSEQIAFGTSYIISAGLTTLLISSYSYFVLHAKKYALVVGLLLSALYGYLYLVLRSEDYALLSGTLLLFGILSTAMFITRKVDWYSVDTKK